MLPMHFTHLMHILQCRDIILQMHITIPEPRRLRRHKGKTSFEGLDLLTDVMGVKFRDFSLTLLWLPTPVCGRTSTGHTSTKSLSSSSDMTGVFVATSSILGWSHLFLKFHFVYMVPTVLSHFLISTIKFRTFKNSHLLDYDATIASLE